MLKQFGERETHRTAGQPAAVSLEEIVALGSSSAASTSSERAPLGVVVGRLVGREESGRPLVDFPGNRAQGPLAARSMVALDDDQLGREVVLMFEGCDPAKPILLGLLQDSLPPGSDEADTEETGRIDEESVIVRRDDDQLVLKADRQIVLQCGNASITLTRAGKVLIRGAYLLSRSSGVNRIKGGSVQIN